MASPKRPADRRERLHEPANEKKGAEDNKEGRDPTHRKPFRTLHREKLWSTNVPVRLAVFSSFHDDRCVGRSLKMGRRNPSCLHPRASLTNQHVTSSGMSECWSTNVVMTVKGYVFLCVSSRASCHCDERVQWLVICLYRVCAFQCVTVHVSVQVHIFISTTGLNLCSMHWMSLHPSRIHVFQTHLKITVSCLPHIYAFTCAHVVCLILFDFSTFLSLQSIFSPIVLSFLLAINFIFHDVVDKFPVHFC